jgi:putative transposase
MVSACRYVALNPVRAGLCNDPAEWPWGSYRALAGLERPPDFLDVKAVHGLFSLHPEGAAKAYKAFVPSVIEGLGCDPSSSLQAARPFDASASPRKLAATRATASS